MPLYNIFSSDGKLETITFQKRKREALRLATRLAKEAKDDPLLWRVEYINSRANVRAYEEAMEEEYANFG
jgi:hypothetical protein